MSRLFWLLMLLPAPLLAGQGDLLERGRQVFIASNCQYCHTDTDNGGSPLAGGRALKTEFGTFLTPNITPDPETGIGKWSDEDFVRALREGVAPDGHYYFPAFPFTSYTKMRRDDMLALKAYLFSQPPVRQRNREHDLPLYLRITPAARVWNLAWFEAGEFRDDPGKSPEWNRGAYLVLAMGHCVECHTPRRAMGVLDEDRLFAGVQSVDGETVPNITPDRKTGIGRWSIDDLVYFFQTGTMLDGDVAGGKMARIIDDSLSRLPEADLRAMAVYLKSLPPVVNGIRRKKKERRRKEEWE